MGKTKKNLAIKLPVYIRCFIVIISWQGLKIIYLRRKSMLVYREHTDSYHNKSNIPNIPYIDHTVMKWRPLSEGNRNVCQAYRSPSPPRMAMFLQQKPILSEIETSSLVKTDWNRHSTLVLPLKR